MGIKVIDPYAVIGGKIIAVTPWEGIILMSMKIQSGIRWLWLIKEKVVFTDTYEDAITKESIITSSIALEDEGVLA